MGSRPGPWWDTVKDVTPLQHLLGQPGGLPLPWVSALGG